ncbi:hypothetical protein ACFO9E_28755 [Streptomyces maoxianensis]|uniref:Uncharacterized protein n=1 Tax=Streptomyces maoxianensis TaxID=1459942 RepID=A0ABV9GFA8_9ACTN
MTANTVEKARAAAERAAQELAKLEAQEAEKAAQEAAKREEAQAVKDRAFLERWEALDTELEDQASGNVADAIYNGVDAIQAVATIHIAHIKRGVIRARAREAYRRLNGEFPTGSFAMALGAGGITIAHTLEYAISDVAARHAADLADALDAEWLVK